jgi:hypothetical protein
MRTAAIALQFCAVCTGVFSAQRLNLPQATAVACSVFAERAFDMMQLRTTQPSTVELVLVRNAQIVLEEERRFRATSGIDWHARVLNAWRRLQSSGVLQRRGIPECVGLAVAEQAHVTATAAATAATRGLCVCALHTCGAQEVHTSHFKRCAACLSAVYCCKEHQVQDCWPAHKAACRVACKAGEQAADAASDA